MSKEDGLPKGWAMAAINEVAQSIQYGHTASAIHQTVGPRFLRITDIQHGQVNWDTVPSCDISDDDLEKCRLSDGDIVFARTGATTGKSYLIRNCPEAVFASYLIRLRMVPGLHPGYLQAFFQTLDYWRQIESGKRGIGQPNVNAQTLGQIVFPVAPHPEQRRIVAKIEELFSDLDAGVAALERAKANLKRYRAAVLKAAVEGKLTEQWRAKNPPKESATKLLERILKERRQKWEQDQLAAYEANGKQPPKNWRDKYQEPTGPDTGNLPALPEGWCWVAVEQLGDVQLGRQRSPKNQSKDFPTQYIRAANLTERGLDVSDVLDMEFKPKEVETYRLAKGDIVVSEASGSPEQVGKPAVWNDELPLCCFQNTVIRLRPHHRASSPFLLTVFRHCYFNKVFAKVAAGVGINHLSAAKFARLVIPLAPEDEQAEVAAEVERRLSILAQSDSLFTANLKRAARLRQSILKRAFQGKLVPQDATDEPAGKLLTRIRTAAGQSRTMTTDGKRAARRTHRSAAMTGEEIEP